MKVRSRYTSSLLGLILLISFLLAGCHAQSRRPARKPPPGVDALHTSQEPCGGDLAFHGYAGCTVFYAADESVALGGNSEDYGNPLAYAWIVPAEPGAYARFYVGFDNHIAQGGMNDQGLFFDGLGGLSPTQIDTEGKQQFRGVLADKIMAECADVACVEEMFEQYYSAEIWAHQFLFGDRFGNSIIVEPNNVLPKDGAYQVATNFRQSSTPPEERTCWRYQAALELLDAADTYDVPLFEQILDAVHVENTTIYATIYDLKQTRVYLYYFHDYEHVVTFDLPEEAGKGEQTFLIETLFPRNADAEEWKEPIMARYQGLVSQRLDETISSEGYADYEGRYTLPPDDWGENMTFKVHQDEERLMLQWPHGPLHVLFPQAADSFFQISYLGERFEMQYEVNFLRDDGGQVVQAVVEYAGEPMQCAKIGVTPSPSTTPILPTATASALPSETPVSLPIPAEMSAAEQDASRISQEGSWWLLLVLFGGFFGAVVVWFWRRR